MANFSRATALSLLLLLINLAATCESAARPWRPAPTDFIKSSCGATRYPALCIQSLSVYAPAIKRSPRQLTQTALSVSLSRARSVSAFVNRLMAEKGIRGRDRAAVRDCVENMGDTVDRLSRSMREMGQVGAGSEFDWHMSNVETWVSAALTDENSCLDGFAGMRDRVRATVRGKVLNVAQVTSNALALVNRFAQRRPVGVKAP